MFNIQQNIADYFSSTKVEFSNENSWLYCHKAFGYVSDPETLALHLTAYLASWGMYRGSSGLAKTNFKVHEGAVKKILNKRDELYCTGENQKFDNLKAIVSLKEELEGYYCDIDVYWGEDLKKNKEAVRKISSTQTLISKIMLGTLGCIPAFDTNLIKGLEKINKLPENQNIPYTFNKISVSRLIEMAKAIDTKELDLPKEYVTYPKMKLLDMALFQFGLTAM